MNITIRRASFEDREEWLNMRKELWPDAPEEDLRAELDAMLANEREAVFFAIADERPVGMLEARLRDYADGCETSPVGYIEAWFVYKPYRGTGAAGRLVEAAEDWARGCGCKEMASDTWLDNEPSIRAHKRLGYREAERLVHFVKRL